MKAEYWNFQGYLPDDEDITARLHAMEAYFSLPSIIGRSTAEEIVDAFLCWI